MPPSQAFETVPELTPAYVAKLAAAAERGHRMRGRLRGNGHLGSPRQWMVTCSCGWASDWGPIAEVRGRAQAHADVP